jgi:hypothetical protein
MCVLVYYYIEAYDACMCMCFVRNNVYASMYVFVYRYIEAYDSCMCMHLFTIMRTDICMCMSWTNVCL